MKKSSSTKKKSLSKFDLLGIEYGLKPDPKNPGQCVYKRLTNCTETLKLKEYSLDLNEK